MSCDGCRHAGCCYQPVATFIAEALWIAKNNSIPVDTREDLIKDGIAMENSPKDWYFQQAIPCAFLKADKTCAIYAQRPGACRRYNVISAPQLCMPGSTKKVGALNTMALDGEWVTTMIKLQVINLGVPPEPVMMGALPKMVAIAANVLDLPNGRAVRRYLRDQKWLGFDQPMAEVDPEVLAAYRLG